jgi:hypothetical protein
MMAMTAAMMAMAVPVRRMTVRMIINVVMVVAVIIATSMIPMAAPKINAERANTDVLRHSRPSIENSGGGKQSEPEIKTLSGKASALSPFCQTID